MSNIIDNIGHVFEKARDYVEEHPWQTAAAVLAGPLVGPALLAGAAATKDAVAKGLLPAITLGEAAAVGAGVLAGTAAGVGGAMAIEAAAVGLGIGIGVEVLAGGAVAKGAVEAAKGVAEAAKSVEKAIMPAEATTKPSEANPPSLKP